MKKFCRYAVIDIKTGYLLVGGQKWKDFERGPIRYIYVGKFKTFPLFGRTLTEYFRTVEINGVQCAIVYWAQNKGKQLYNCVTLSGLALRLNGREFVFNKSNLVKTYRSLMLRLGITYENI